MGVIQSRKTAIKNLNKITEDPGKVLFIHYSEGRTYDDEYGSISPIITSLVIKSMDGQIDKQFAIHLEADKADIQKDQIQDSYRELEMRILNQYNDFVKRHSDYTWIHWDMKNIHFGFEAISHRYEKIFGSLKDYSNIPYNNKENLRTIIEGMYGDNFASSSDTLKELILCNSNNNNNENSKYMNNSQESEEFGNKNFNNVLQSVDFKVDFIKKATKKLKLKQLNIPNKNKYALFLDFTTHPIITITGWLFGLLGLIFTIWSQY